MEPGFRNTLQRHSTATAHKPDCVHGALMYANVMYTASSQLPAFSPATMQSETRDEPEMAHQELVVKQDSKTEAQGMKQENGATAGELVSDEVVRERLLLLLADSDLATTTEKMLRKTLETDLGVKLGDRKALIRDEVRRAGTLQ